MTHPHRRLGAALALTAAALLFAACASPQDPATAGEETATPVPVDTPAATPSGDPDVEPGADPTCETLIPADMVAEFEEIGWTAQAQPFWVGEVQLTEGLMCVWADFDGPAGDHLQIFGWSEISDEDAAAAQEQLEAQGWIREEAEDGVYVTENPDTTIATDDEGYGLTYLFTDGTVTHADTKQGLVLIEWPRT
ncbi:hypothetical protein [Microbacterium sp. Marseille-Q6648]|jgi:hypothetical protein|uniref:hypothetical protein n=1 Tax=Microbacterium sp. Marseille-Q6648 TaxID=2937991 RepID=UPI00204253D6|nr:hypothetical protein [Microbacterium sp. Marseille-Q6648]